MVEERRAIQNLPAMLEQVPGIGVVLIGEGDLSQDLGYPRQYEHPTVVSAMDEVLAICKAHNIPCGHPHASAQNLDYVLEKGFRWLMISREISYNGLEAGRKATGRA
jgi:4-hydroxy-2-oxoheptanedioate aldolase